MRCAVACCNSDNEAKILRFHTFPKDIVTRKLWIIACCRKDNFNSNTARICSKHFKSEDYQRNLQQELLHYESKKGQKLKPEAVPTLYLPKSKSVTLSSNQKKRTQRAQHRESQKFVQQLLNTELTSFPKDAERRKTWIQFVERSNWQPSKNSKLCSKHFAEKDIDRTSLVCVCVRDNAIPTIRECQNYDYRSIQYENNSSEAVEPTSSTPTEPTSSTPIEPTSIMQPSRNIPTIQRCENTPELQVPSKHVTEAFNNLNKVISKKSSKEDGDVEDECDIFGKLIAKKLKKIPENERDSIMFDIHALFRRGVERSPSLDSLRSSTSCNSSIPSDVLVKRPKFEFVLVSDQFNESLIRPKSETESKSVSSDYDDKSSAIEYIYES